MAAILRMEHKEGVERSNIVIDSIRSSARIGQFPTGMCTRTGHSSLLLLILLVFFLLIRTCRFIPLVIQTAIDGK